MAPEQRLKFMREWLEDLKNIMPEDNQKEIECLGWAIKQCKKNVDRKRDKEKSYW